MNLNQLRVAARTATEATFADTTIIYHAPASLSGVGPTIGEVTMTALLDHSLTNNYGGANVRRKVPSVECVMSVYCPQKRSVNTVRQTQNMLT